MKDVQMEFDFWGGGENVIHLANPDPNPEINREDMTVIERVRGFVRQGDSMGLAVAMIREDGSIMTIYSPPDNVFQMIGAIETLKMRIHLDRVME